MTHFLTTPKFDLLLYIGDKCAKNPYFYHFFWKKEVKLGKNKKKSWCGHQLRTMAYFSKYHTFDPLLYLVCQMLRTLFFFLLFLGKTGQITRYLGEKTYGHQLQLMTHSFTNHKFDLLSYISIINFLNLPVHTLIRDLQKKNLRASTRTHDPFSGNSKIWPTFIYRREVPADTFAKLPVHALINDPQKN